MSGTEKVEQLVVRDVPEPIKIDDPTDPVPSLNRPMGDPTGERLATKIRRVDPDDPDDHVQEDGDFIQYDCHVVELMERFETVYGKEYGEAKGEESARSATETISSGWWIKLDGFPISFHVGDLKPDGLDVGRKIRISLRAM
jgi:hypothetical protein